MNSKIIIRTQAIVNTIRNALAKEKKELFRSQLSVLSHDYRRLWFLYLHMCRLSDSKSSQFIHRRREKLINFQNGKINIKTTSTTPNRPKPFRRRIVRSFVLSICFTTFYDGHFFFSTLFVSRTYIACRTHFHCDREKPAKKKLKTENTTKKKNGSVKNRG